MFYTQLVYGVFFTGARSMAVMELGGPILGARHAIGQCLKNRVLNIQVHAINRPMGGSR